MTRYIERPKLVRAVQFTGGNAKEVFDFCKARIKYWTTADFYLAGNNGRGEMQITGVSRYKTRDIYQSYEFGGECHNYLVAKEPLDWELTLREGDFLVQPKKADPLVMVASDFHQRYVETA